MDDAWVKRLQLVSSVKGLKQLLPPSQRFNASAEVSGTHRAPRTGSQRDMGQISLPTSQGPSGGILAVCPGATRAITGDNPSLASPPPGYQFIECDLSQAELRIVAWMAGEKTMLKTYQSGGDIHSVTAALIMGITIAQFMALPKPVKKRKRQEAKA